MKSEELISALAVCIPPFAHPISVYFRKRNDANIKEVEKKRTASQETLGKLQQQYQQFLTKAAAKA